MSDKGELDVRCGEVGGRVLGVLDIVEPRGVDGVAVCREGLADGRMVGEGLEPGEGVRVEGLAGASDGIAGEVDEGRRVAATRDGVVVVAGEDDGAARADEGEGFLREGAVADDVAEADDLVRAAAFGVREDAFEGLEVGVDVGEDGVAHGRDQAFLKFFGRRRPRRSFSQKGSVESHQVAKRMGQGKAMRPTLRSTRRRMMRAALSASMKNGMGQVFLSVMRERTKPGQMTETRTPSARRCPRRDSPHVLTQLLVAE